MKTDDALKLLFITQSSQPRKNNLQSAYKKSFHNDKNSMYSVFHVYIANEITFLLKSTIIILD